ncbi:hypothetical protein [Luethyella okanaganae]|uniref:Septum formation-related domain-containing protein n=1 Tax=Luethyella okanaganae TaxID=69372 RepID=A0ABW1VDW3_9MICO
MADERDEHAGLEPELGGTDWLLSQLNGGRNAASAAGAGRPETGEDATADAADGGRQGARPITEPASAGAPVADAPPIEPIAPTTAGPAPAPTVSFAPLEAAPIEPALPAETTVPFPQSPVAATTPPFGTTQPDFFETAEPAALPGAASRPASPVVPSYPPAPPAFVPASYPAFPGEVPPVAPGAKASSFQPPAQTDADAEPPLFQPRAAPAETRGAAQPPLFQPPAPPDEHPAVTAPIPAVPITLSTDSGPLPRASEPDPSADIEPDAGRPGKAGFTWGLNPGDAVPTPAQTAAPVPVAPVPVEEPKPEPPLAERSLQPPEPAAGAGSDDDLAYWLAPSVAREPDAVDRGGDAALEADTPTMRLEQSQYLDKTAATPEVSASALPPVGFASAAAPTVSASIGAPGPEVFTAASAIQPPSGPVARSGSRAASRPARGSKRTTRTLIWLASALLLAVVLIGLYVFGTKLPALFGGQPVAAPPSATTSETPTPTPPPVPTGPQAAGTHDWDTLFGGECIDPFTSPWDGTFTVVDCGAPHRSQLVYRGSFVGDAATVFPGEEALASQINLLCSAPGVIDFTAAAPFPDLQLQGSYPVTAEQWTAGQRNYYCFITRSSGEPITASVAGPGPAA